MAAASPDSRAVPEATVSSRILQVLVSAVERAGVGSEQFLQAANLEPGLLDSADGRLLRSELLRCCEIAFDLTEDPAFGIHWAESLTANTFNLLPQLLAHAATVRQAFATLFQFGDLLTDQLDIRLVEHADEAQLRIESHLRASLRVRRMAAEMAMLGILRMLRDFSAQVEIRQANFEYSAPVYRGEYTRVFDGTERFDQPFTGLVFDSALLDLPSPHRDPDIQNTLRTLAEQRVSRIRACVPYALRIRELLMQERAPHRVSMTSIADRLGVSLRSLHRRLADEGQSFTAIATQASAVLAKRLLSEEQRTIQEAAFAMGFADASSFHRAFKRWTGSTPRRFRLRR
ncbi:MAG TPA: AraC family transcriptional regulator [Polyangiales bacterium]|nr:AraC family transcriptional regulator [Polyangiales bacterium]